MKSLTLYGLAKSNKTIIGLTQEPKADFKAHILVCDLLLREEGPDQRQLGESGEMIEFFC